MRTRQQAREGAMRTHQMITRSISAAQAAKSAPVAVPPNTSTAVARAPTIRIFPKRAAAQQALRAALKENPNYNPSMHFRFLALPPELRNRVYEYAVLDHEDIKIQKGVRDIPGVVHVSHQVYSESRGIYLAKNQFIFICEDADISALLRFFRALHLAKDTAAIESIAPLMIFCHGKIFPSRSDYKHFKYPTLHDWDVWSRNLQQLKALGLRPDQLRWSTWLEVEEDQRTPGWDEFNVGEAGAMKAILHENVLPELMREIGFVPKKAEAIPPVVFDDLVENWSKYGLDDESSDDLFDYLDYFCHDREWMYVNRQRDLIDRRNELVDEVIDRAFYKQVEETCRLLRELKEFDVIYGVCTHRDPAVASRLLSRLGEKTDHSSQNAIGTAEPNEEDGLMQGASLAVEMLSETDEEKKLREDNEQEVNLLHSDHQLEYHVLGILDEQAWLASI